ncbi:MAG: hypothetical protein PV347_04290 [Rickettsiaceae bacterium]|nr:hypothetical protein [Rickettsiaceae bacterium]
MLLKTITRSEYQKFLNKYEDSRNSETVRKVNCCLAPCIREEIYDSYLKKDSTYNVVAKGTKKAKSDETKFLTINKYLSILECFKTRND